MTVAQFPMKITQHNITCTLEEDGTFTAPEGYKIDYFQLDNSNFYGASQRFYQKEFPTFIGAFKDAVRKIEKRADWANYHVNVHLRREEDTSLLGGGSLNICTLSQRNGESEFSLSLNGIYNHPIPKAWIPIKRKQGKVVDELIAELCQDYHIKSITFRTSISHKKKLTFLDQIKGYFSHLSEFVDFKAFPPSEFATSGMTKFGGSYNADGVINLIIGTEESFYHEYFHHLDLSTAPLRHFEIQDKSFVDLTKAGELYRQLGKALLDTETMKRFINFNSYLLDEKGNVKKGKQNTKAGKHFDYWTSYSEMTARFFEDMMNYRMWKQASPDIVENEQTSKVTRNFKEHEVEEHQELMMRLIDELATLSRQEQLRTTK